MKRHSTIAMYIAAFVLCTAGVLTAVVGDTWAGRSPLSHDFGVTGEPGASPSPAPAELSLDERLNSVSQSTVVTQDMSIFWVTRYTKCGHEKVRELPPDQQMVGKTLAEFAASYPGFKLEINSGVIRMERTIEQYCPDHYIIKGDDNGNIYVYRNMEGLDKLAMVTKLSFPTSSIPADYRPLLEEGMAFGSIEEIEGLIEDAES